MEASFPNPCRLSVAAVSASPTVTGPLPPGRTQSGASTSRSTLFNPFDYDGYAVDFPIHLQDVPENTGRLLRKSFHSLPILNLSVRKSRS